MTSRTRRQHVVSRFYLNGFANEDQRVARVELPGDVTRVLSTGDAGVIKDFYTITLPDGTKSDFFERAFGEVEGLAAEAMRAITSGVWPVPDEHRASLAAWIALQHLRSEDVRAGQGSMRAGMIQLIVGVSGRAALREVIERAERRTISDEELDWEWADLTKSGGPDLAEDPDEHLRLLSDLLPGTTHYFYDCHWTLYRFQRRVLVTSDHPVSLCVEPDYPAYMGVGLATADLFVVPLSRRLGLTIQPRTRLERYPVDPTSVPDFAHDGTTAIARSFNQETVGRARRYVYHHPEDQPLIGLHIPEPDTRRGPQTSDIDRMVHEDGLFHGMTTTQKQALSSPAGGSSEGMSIDDLPWPIPGRRISGRPHFS